MNGTPATGPRWQNYVLERGDGLTRFWRDHLEEHERCVLLVLGLGFDPRMCLGLEAILAAGGAGRRDVMLIVFREGDESPSLAQAERTAANRMRLEGALGTRGLIQAHEVPCWNEQRQRVGAQQTLRLFDSAHPLRGHTDVVVDISALPRGLYFPLLARLLHWVDTADSWPDGPAPNLHVLVAEDPDLDARIEEVGIDDTAEFLPSFQGGFNVIAKSIPSVWMPLLGEGRLTHMERVYELVKPDQVAPVLPSPARDPRRADRILLGYQEFLFDQLKIDPRNVLYASEQNPFEVYRQVRKAALHYGDVLQIIGGCKIALSALSSKLMSLGALLVAYELKLGVAHADCHGYSMESPGTCPELVGLWLAGECYAC
jgi:hypothetical protein